MLSLALITAALAAPSLDVSEGHVRMTDGGEVVAEAQLSAGDEARMVADALVVLRDVSRPGPYGEISAGSVELLTADGKRLVLTDPTTTRRLTGDTMDLSTWGAFLDVSEGWIHGYTALSTDGTLVYHSIEMAVPGAQITAEGDVVSLAFHEEHRRMVLRLGEAAWDHRPIEADDVPAEALAAAR